jgi:hypothetical protein
MNVIFYLRPPSKVLYDLAIIEKADASCTIMAIIGRNSSESVVCGISKTIVIQT